MAHITSPTVGLIPSHVNVGVVTAAFRKGQCSRQEITFCQPAGSTCLLKPRGAHDTVLRTLLCQVLQRLGVHGFRLAAVRFLSMVYLAVTYRGERRLPSNLTLDFTFMVCAVCSPFPSLFLRLSFPQAYMSLIWHMSSPSCMVQQ